MMIAAGPGIYTTHNHDLVFEPQWPKPGPPGTAVTVANACQPPTVMARHAGGSPGDGRRIPSQPRAGTGPAPAPPGSIKDVVSPNLRYHQRCCISPTAVGPPQSGEAIEMENMICLLSCAWFDTEYKLGRKDRRSSRPGLPQSHCQSRWHY